MKSVFRVTLLLLAAASVLSDHHENKTYKVNGLYLNANTNFKNNYKHEVHKVMNYTEIRPNILRPNYHVPHFDAEITAPSSKAPTLYPSANTNHKETLRKQPHTEMNYTGIGQFPNEVLQPKYHAPLFDTVIMVQSNQNSVMAKQAYMNFETNFKCASDNGIFLVPGHCELYMQCKNGQAFVKICPSNLHFNALMKECDIPNHAKCQPKCPTEVGYFPVPGECSSYIFCSNGQPSLRTCATGKHFSASNNRCIQPDSPKCEPICTTANGKICCTRLVRCIPSLH